MLFACLHFVKFVVKLQASPKSGVDFFLLLKQEQPSPKLGHFNIRMELFAGTDLANNTLFAGTVPENNTLFAGPILRLIPLK